MVHVEVVETSELGDRSYIAHDGVTAVVIDPNGTWIDSRRYSQQGD